MDDQPDHPAFPAKPRPAEPTHHWFWKLSGAFRDAICGLVLVTGRETNARYHAIATVVVLGAGFAFGLTALEWALIAFAIAAVWAAEAMNTAIELTVDLLSPGANAIAGRAKDAAAGAVLATAIGAAIVGACIFGPKIVALVR